MKFINSPFGKSIIFLKTISLSNLSLFLFCFFISVSNSISAIILILFFISFLFSKKTHQNIKTILLKPINKSILIFYLFILISFFWSENIFSPLIISEYSILLIIPFLELLNFKKSDKKKAIFFFLFGIIFNILYSFLVSILYKLNLIENMFFLKNDHYQNEFFLRGFIDHSSLSLLVSFSIFILLHIVLKKTDNKKILNRKILYPLIFILILFLLNSYGRTGFFILIILFPIFLLIKNPKNVKYLVFFSLLFLFISVSVSRPFKDRIKSTFVFQKDSRTDDEKIKEDAQYMADSLGKSSNYWEKKIREDLTWKNEVITKNKKSSMERRYEIWEKYKTQILKKPFIGTGAGGVNQIITNTNIMHRPHNSYILIIFEFGIIGLILFLNIFYVQLKSFFLNKNKKETTLKLIFPLLFLICMTINDYIIIYNTVCFFSLFSFLLYSEENCNLD